MISTKKGDNGKTKLANNETVYKDDLHVEAYGTVDELNSYLGYAKHFLNKKEKEIIENIQKDLFRVATELAKGEKFINLISKEDEEKITKLVEEYEKKVNLNSFVLTGATKESSILDICRTIARRAERRIVSLSKRENVRKELIAYINRISDLLYIMARYIEKDNITPYSAHK
ncbi:cob(I)yrinic acid a,c-diamide adenosyltransferase [Thermosipho globiformans]|uniref:cob(I)yrinic acid a,c-diamide adenosyltransferase n=1 Tax=Thermosipho globiformans TaxID=380685 RepID=UPI000F8DF105|nr:cob(I)yrinic acid a,c-diamide adenosyltransferase [Thermosipho globiformans]